MTDTENNNINAGEAPHNAVPGDAAPQPVTPSEGGEAPRSVILSEGGEAAAVEGSRAAPADAAPAPPPPPAPADAAPTPTSAAPAKKSQRKWTILAVVLLLLIAAAVAVFIWLTSPDPNRDGLQPDANAKIGSLSGDFDDLDKIVDEGMLTFSINVTPAFDNGTSPGNLMIENAEINNNRFTCAIYRKDTGEQIYQSGSLDPGQYIENAPLSVDLDPGTYPCTAYFSTFKLSDNTPIGQAAAEITVYVLG